MTNETICVDASLIVALLLPERYTNLAMNLWEGWANQDARIVAPALLGYEVTSALYRKVFRGIISAEDGRSALQQYINLEIENISLPELHFTATDLAVKFRRPNIYDTHYLTLSNHLASAFWTADERLFNAVKGQFEFVHWVEESIGNI
jgi:predicted nucleic acid-binding protein